MSVALHQLCQLKNLLFLKHLNFNDVLFLTFLMTEFLIEILFFVDENIIDDVKCTELVTKSSIEFNVMMSVKMNCESELRKRKSNTLLKTFLSFALS